MDATAAHIFASLAAIGYWEQRPRLAVAVSGGVDSMVLAHVVRDWVARCGGQVIALIVDHRLREDSTQEAHDVAALLKSAGIEAYILTITETIGLTGIQEKARKLRYQLLEAWCEQHGVLHLLTAHHADDQRETLVMRMMRGATVQGLQGIRDVAYRDDVRYVRPLLQLTKHALLDYAFQHGIVWKEDPTNAKPAYTRNRVRHVMPLLEKEGFSVQRTFMLVDNLRSGNDFIHHTLVKWMVGHVRYHAPYVMSMPLAAYKSLHHEQAILLLRSITSLVSGEDREVRTAELRRLHEALEGASESFHRTLNGCLVVVDKSLDSIFVVKELRCFPEPVCANQQSLGYVLASDLDSAMVVAPLGKHGVAQLKRGKVALPKLPLFVLRAWLAIYRDATLEEVVCIPHMHIHGHSAGDKSLQIAWYPPKPLADW